MQVNERKCDPNNYTDSMDIILGKNNNQNGVIGTGYQVPGATVLSLLRSSVIRFPS